MKRLGCLAGGLALIGAGLMLTPPSLADEAAAETAAAPQPTYIPAPPPPDPPPAVTDAAKRAAIKQIRPTKIILVGDSTTQVGSGWGGAFCATHLTSTVACVDLARGGRGTFDYRAEGSWDLALGEMKTPGYKKIYVLIQFGHNDQPGKPGRTTDLYTEYPANLARYVAEARAAGAVPVLVTPLTRRMFKNGSLQDGLEPWAGAVRKVAGETGTPLVDLHKASVEAVQKMGPVDALALSQIPPPDDVAAAAATGTTIEPPRTLKIIPQSADLATPRARPKLYFDYTHLGPHGAAFFSAMVARELARAVPELRNNLVP